MKLHDLIQYFQAGWTFMQQASGFTWFFGGLTLFGACGLIVSVLVGLK